MALDFFNRNGEAIAYTDDGTHIYSWGGKPLAYIADDKIYSFAGQFRGWFNEGWIRDAAGNAMLFTRSARGGPLKPLLQLTPLKALKELHPLKGFQQFAPFKPFFSLNWSNDRL
jgi:4-fold beta flower protein